jgi:hypothetical protein
MGLRFGTIWIGGGGNCATAPLAEKNKIVSAITLAHLASQ